MTTQDPHSPPPPEEKLAAAQADARHAAEDLAGQLGPGWVAAPIKKTHSLDPPVIATCGPVRVEHQRFERKYKATIPVRAPDDVEYPHWLTITAYAEGAPHDALLHAQSYLAQWGRSLQGTLDEVTDIVEKGIEG